MKKFFLIMLASIASFSIYAQDVNTIDMKEVKPLTNTQTRALYPLLGSVSVNLSDIIFPWTFSVPAPIEDIDEVHGPTGPNTSYWYEQNGILYLTITERAEPQLSSGGQFEFVIKTKIGTYHSVMLYVY